MVIINILIIKIIILIKIKIAIKNNKIIKTIITFLIF